MMFFRKKAQFPFILLVLVHWCYSSIILSSPISRIEFLANAGFEHFKATLSYYQNDPTKHELNNVLSNKNFKLLYTCLSKEIKPISEQELSKIFFWANIYIATGNAIERIFETIFDHVSKSQKSHPELQPYKHVHLELKNYVAKQTRYGVSIIENEIQLDGWEVTKETKAISIFLLTSLTSFFSSITIKRIPIDDIEFDQIQSSLHSNLTSVYFFDCQFLVNGKKYLNFQQLSNLTHFQFSECYCERFIRMMRTISKDSLISLDISNNILSKGTMTQLMSILKEFKQLETLNVSYELPYKNRAPFSGEILQLINLKSLNLSGNLNVGLFTTQLKTLKNPSKLEYLDISKNADWPNESNILNCSLVIYQISFSKNIEFIRYIS